MSTTLYINWSKVNTGAAGPSDANAIVFPSMRRSARYSTNGEGMLTIQTAANNGATPITSGATYAWVKYAGSRWTIIA